MDFFAELGRWFLENWSGDHGWLIRLWEHVEISGLAVIAAAAVAIPLGAWLGHTGRGGLAVISVVNIGRALPSFGILALALPLTIWLHQVGLLSSGLGFAPTFVALFALGLPPVFTNTYAGVRGIDPEVVEAARGMGFTGSRLLRDVEFPLALPVILTGVRVTAVQVVATATLGALVGYGGLGRFIIDGFATQNDVRIVAGALLVAILSIITEVSFSLVERCSLSPGITVARKADAAIAR
ncbi:MAG TPA: ABC transporter permease [Acidimicrobiia bacterium]|nr:ABC transporter permease [Acidimicrobiia bacterium]